MRKIVLHTLGSYGDLHPFMAIGLELKRRGHQAVIATHEFYRRKVEAEGLAFHPVRPDIDPQNKELSRMIMDVKKGPETVLRDVIFPALRDSYHDLIGTVEGSDLLVSAAVTFAAPLAAEKTGVPWASSVFAPMQFWSKYDPPVLTPFPHLAFLRKLGPKVNQAVINWGKSVTRPWAEPVYTLRKELGLPQGEHPVFEGQFSPRLVLALFSPLMGNPQPDWPAQTVAAGFAFYDRDSDFPEAARLEDFLSSGAPPIVFTLGTAAVRDAGEFYVESVAAARKLGRRSLLLVGDVPENIPPGLGADELAIPYAPFSQVFPRAAAIVHQGGIGTCGQALRSGRPMVVVPYSHDQPDNAARLQKIGVARVVRRHQYKANRVARALTEVMGHADYAVHAARASKCVRVEGGVYTACQALENLLPRSPTRFVPSFQG